LLLILTSTEDFAADYLITALLDRDLPYFRLNSEDIAQAEIEFELSATRQTRRFAVGGRAFDFAEVTSVWYRRTIHPLPAPGLDHGESRFVAGELRHLVGGLVLDQSVQWVNPIFETARAEHKLFQLRLANAIGLKTPRTIVSSDAATLRRFVQANAEGTICKPIYHGLLVSGRERFAVYTRAIDADAIDSEMHFRVCPVLLQERIPKGADLRVTIIGEAVFAVEIVGDKESLLDWRKPDSSVVYKLTSVPDDIVRSCRQLLSSLGLVYGAFDFVRTPDRQFYFLEVNPTGEWAWLEDQLGLPMREAFMKLFFRPDEPRC